MGNYIGTNTTGTAALANNYGIYISGTCADTVIGGTSTGSGNVISGNTVNGIQINDSSAFLVSGTRIQGNYIGVNAAGAAVLGNGGDGINLTDNSPNTLIGGATVAARNIISGSGGAGVYAIGTGLGGCLIQGNYIGLNAAGTVALPNTLYGIQAGASTACSFAGVAALPGTPPGNVISGNNIRI